MLRRGGVSRPLLAASAPTWIVGSGGDNGRMSWFQKVWDKARFDSAAAAHAPGKPGDGSGAGNTAAALSHQLLKIHGDTGTGFPHYVTVALWDAYARVSPPPVEGE